MQQQADEKAKILKTTHLQPAGEELKSRISGGGKALSSKAKSMKAAARSSATSAALTRSSKVRLFSYCCFKRVSIVYVFSRPEAESAQQQRRLPRAKQRKQKQRPLRVAALWGARPS